MVIEMNISGIRPYEGFYKYNSTKINQLRNLQIEEAKNLQEPVQPEEMQLISSAEASFDTAGEQNDIRNRQSFNAYDYARGYKSDVSYDLKGADSDINSLDVEKALSDLRKDKVLQQYQLFAGDRMQQGMQSAARSLENFFL